MKRIFSNFGSVASVALAVFCPACIPGIAAFLGSLGLSILASHAVLTPLLIVFLGLALLVLVLGYRRHHNPWPLTAGIAGAASLYAGKWIVFSLPLLYTGAAFLIGASLTNTWLRRRISTCCTVCSVDQDRGASHKRNDRTKKVADAAGAILQGV